MLVAGRSDEEATLVADPRTARGRTLPPLVVAIAAVLNADLEKDIVAKTGGRMMVWQLDVETLKMRRRLGNQGLDRCAFPQVGRVLPRGPATTDSDAGGRAKGFPRAAPCPCRYMSAICSEPKDRQAIYHRFGMRQASTANGGYSDIIEEMS